MEKYRRALDYIERYWKNITFFLPRNTGTHIGLPHPFVSPSNDIFRSDQFYWDSYFTILGLVASSKVKLARGMVDNLLWLYKTFDIIPTRNRLYNLGISQIPFLTSMVREVFSETRDRRWLRSAAHVAEQELNTYWMGERGAVRHLAFEGLSRYCDHYVAHLTAEHESGWDYTSRFLERCLDFLPVDLNACLYRYECDLSDFYALLGRRAKAKRYHRQAQARKRRMMRFLWDERRGFFFDYDFRRKKRSTFFSLAGFYPLWAGMLTTTQAKRTLRNLKRFEHKGGLANTQRSLLLKPFRQWDFPNGWPNQQWIVIKGLWDYGFIADANRLATKWLDLNVKIFKRTGQFWEKYDVVHEKIGRAGHYPTRAGFGWTNAIFVRLSKLLQEKQ